MRKISALLVLCLAPLSGEVREPEGLFVTADYLYWAAQENDLVMCYKQVGNTKDLNFSEIDMGDSWSSGVRLGVGYTLPCDGWTFLAEWTHFSNSVKKNETGLETEGNMLFNPYVIGRGTPTTTKGPGRPQCLTNLMEASWSLDYNLVDVLVSRRLTFCPEFGLGAFSGVRFCDTSIKFDTLSQGDESGTNFISTTPFSTKFKNEFKGVGLVAGVAPEWQILSWLNLFSRSSVALLWGKQEESLFGTPITEGTVTPTIYQSASTLHALQGMFDLELGLRFEHQFCNGMGLGLDVGWEYHLLYNHVTRNLILNAGTSFTGTELYIDSYEQVTNSLALGGLFVRLGLDF